MDIIKSIKTQITRKTHELENLGNEKGTKAIKQKLMQQLTELDIKLRLFEENKQFIEELDSIDNLNFIDSLDNTYWKDLDELKEHLLENNYGFDFYKASFTILRFDYIDDKFKSLQEQELYNSKSGNYTFKKTNQGILVSL